MIDVDRLCNMAREAVPKVPPGIIEWGEANVIFTKSARSKQFNISITPWLREPLERAIDMATRILTLVKPVQSGGSVFGELLILYWLTFWRGFLQYNWSNDKRAEERWDSRVKNVLESCSPVARLMSALPPGESTKCEVDFGRIFFRMQGAFIADNLDSDSVNLQINEEVHAWERGHLKKARGRTTAVWNYKSIDISNAGSKDDQLGQAHADGTQQWWLVKCPGCSNPHHEANSVYHKMRTRWDERRPDLGGLRSDSDKAVDMITTSWLRRFGINFHVGMKSMTPRRFGGACHCLENILTRALVRIWPIAHTLMILLLWTISHGYNLSKISMTRFGPGGSEILNHGGDMSRRKNACHLTWRTCRLLG